MNEKNDEIIKKLIQWRMKELQLDIKDTNNNSTEQIKQMKHELDGLKKHGIDAIGSAYLLFNAGNVVRLTIQAGDGIINRDARILLFTESHIIFIDIKTNAIFQVLKDNIIMVELLEIPSGKFHEYLEVDINNWTNYDEQKGEKGYG